MERILNDIVVCLSLVPHLNRYKIYKSLVMVVMYLEKKEMRFYHWKKGYFPRFTRCYSYSLNNKKNLFLNGFSTQHILFTYLCNLMCVYMMICSLYIYFFVLFSTTTTKYHHYLESTLKHRKILEIYSILSFFIPSILLLLFICRWSFFLLI